MRWHIRYAWHEMRTHWVSFPTWGSRWEMLAPPIVVHTPDFKSAIEMKTSNPPVLLRRSHAELSVLPWKMNWVSDFPTNSQPEKIKIYPCSGGKGRILSAYTEILEMEYFYSIFQVWLWLPHICQRLSSLKPMAMIEQQHTFWLCRAEFRGCQGVTKITRIEPGVFTWKTRLKGTSCYMRKVVNCLWASGCWIISND